VINGRILYKVYLSAPFMLHYFLFISGSHEVISGAAVYLFPCDIDQYKLALFGCVVDLQRSVDTLVYDNISKNNI
jgi:hypothetical protein